MQHTPQGLPVGSLEFELDQCYPGLKLLPLWEGECPSTEGGREGVCSEGIMRAGRAFQGVRSNASSAGR